MYFCNLSIAQKRQTSKYISKIRDYLILYPRYSGVNLFINVLLHREYNHSSCYIVSYITKIVINKYISNFYYYSKQTWFYILNSTLNS